MVVKAKKSTYMGKEKTNYYAVELAPCVFGEHNKLLLNRLLLYKSFNPIFRDARARVQNATYSEFIDRMRTY